MGDAEPTQEQLAAEEASLRRRVHELETAATEHRRAELASDAQLSLAALRRFGYERVELLGQPFEILLPESVRAAHLEHRKGYFAEPRVRPMGIGLDLSGRR